MILYHDFVLGSKEWYMQQDRREQRESETKLENIPRS